MSDKINVFEILGQNHTELEIKDQEQVYVLDPDFNDATKQLEQRNNVVQASKILEMLKK